MLNKGAAPIAISKRFRRTDVSLLRNELHHQIRILQSQLLKTAFTSNLISESPGNARAQMLSALIYEKMNDFPKAREASE